MKYFAVFDKNIVTIFQLQWNIVNISDMFLQYSVLCGIIIAKITIHNHTFPSAHNLFVTL